MKTITKTASPPLSTWLDAAAITFVVFNLLAAAVFVLIVKDTLGTSGEHTSFLVEHAAKLVGSIYAIVIGCLVLARRAPNLWISGAVVSILTGCALSKHLDGWFAFPFLLPVSVWLIVTSRRFRQELRVQADTGQTTETPASRARALRRLLVKLIPGTLKFIGAYLLGILAGVILIVMLDQMPHEVTFEDFNGISEIGALLVAPFPGLLYFFQVAWWAVLILILLFVLLRRRPLFRSLLPFWIGLAVGFLGVLGSYWLALGSVP